MKKAISFPDRRQKFWQLACIAGSALGVPSMIIGGELAHQHGPGSALISILSGNLILWLIGLAIISMANTNNAIENVKNYLGKKTGYVTAVMVSIAFIIWYAIQIVGVSNLTSHLLDWDHLLALGVGFGLLSAVLSVRGIVLIRKMCMVGVPILVLLAIVLMSTSENSIKWKGSFSFSFSGIFLVILAWLPGILNLPMLFRHAASKVEAVLGLSGMTLLHLFFQTATIVLGIGDMASSLAIPNAIFQFSLLCFAWISYMCVNQVNIYFASAGLEMLLPKIKESRDYLIIGVLGTAVFAVIHFFSKYSDLGSILKILQTTAWSFLGNVALVLAVDFFVKFVIKDHFPSYGKTWSNLIWIFGCSVTLLVELRVPEATVDQAFIAGVSAVFLLFLIFAITNVTLWSFKKLQAPTSSGK